MCLGDRQIKLEQSTYTQPMSKYASRLIAQAKAEGWKRLHLGKTGIDGAVPEEIWELDELEELILGDFWDERSGWEYSDTMSPNVCGHGLRSGISSFPQPPQSVVEGNSQGLQKLRLLSMKRVKLQDYSPLSMMRALTELDVSSSNLGTGDEEKEPPILAPFLSPHLKNLNIYSSDLMNHKDLASQTELEVLRIHGSGVSKELLSNFKQLRHLEVFELYSSLQLSILPELPALEALRWAGSKISGEELLKWLPQLKAFWFNPDAKFIQEEGELYAAAFRQAVHLEHLDVKTQGDFDIANLEKCTQLHSLDISCNRLLGIASLGNLSMLTSLSLTIRYTRYFGQPDVDDSDSMEEGTSKKGSEDWEFIAQQYCDEFIKVIPSLPNLTRLDLNGLPLQDLVSLSGLHQLEHLSLLESKLQSLAGIESFPSLHLLWMSYAPLLDISHIHVCKKLQKIYLMALPLQSLTGLEGANQLKYIHLDDCKINDLEPLSSLMNLEELSCYYFSIQDFSPLRHCQAMRDISLFIGPIRDVEPLAMLPRLHTLLLEYTQVEDLSPLEPWFQKWVFADLPEDEKGHFRTFSDETRVSNPPEYLNHHYTRPKDALNYWDALRVQAGETEFPWRHGVPVPPLNQFTIDYIQYARQKGLTRLDLKASGIIGSVPEEIWEYTELLELNFASSGWSWWENKRFNSYHGGNAITDFPMPPRAVIDGESPGLHQLRGLNLGDTNIAHLDFLPWMPVLQVLEIQGTLVKDLKHAFTLPYLEILDIRETQITDLSGIENLTELRFVYLDGSQVADLGPLKACPKIEKITYTNTPAARLEENKS